MAFYFDSIEGFFCMESHGYCHGPYVWACVLVALLALGLLVILPSVKRRALVKTLVQQSKQQSVSIDNR